MTRPPLEAQALYHTQLYILLYATQHQEQPWEFLHGTWPRSFLQRSLQNILNLQGSPCTGPIAITSTHIYYAR